jgi:hypothetical protein
MQWLSMDMKETNVKLTSKWIGLILYFVLHIGNTQRLGQYLVNNIHP